MTTKQFFKKFIKNQQSGIQDPLFLIHYLLQKLINGLKNPGKKIPCRLFRILIA